MTPTSVTMDSRISPHFTVGEFCNDPVDLHHLQSNLSLYWPRLVKLCRVLETIRDHFGAPVRITSGVRDPKRNAAVGGVPDSQHCKARASDIHIEGITPRQVAHFACTLGDVGGVGKYPSFTHIDVRDRSGGPVAYWEG